MGKFGDFRGVPREVSHRRIDLTQRDLHSSSVKAGGARAKSKQLEQAEVSPRKSSVQFESQKRADSTTIFRHSAASTMEKSIYSAKISGQETIRNQWVAVNAKLRVTANQSRRSSVGRAADS